MHDLSIRESRPSDWNGIEALYAAAFPDEDLVPLVQALLRDSPAVRSLVGMDGLSVVAHVIFTECRIETGGEKAALLGPLAVAPDRQREGIGSRIVRAGLKEMAAAGMIVVYVLGDPAYYRRFGFEKSVRVTPPYPLPREWNEAWQSLTLDDATPPGPGMLSVPEPWRKPELWAP